MNTHKTIIAFAISLIAAATFQSCTSDGNPTYEKSLVLSRSESKTNDEFNNFGLRFFDIYSESSFEQKDYNIAVSPLSLASTLAMVANASDKSDIIQSTLEAESTEELNSLINKLMLYLTEDNGNSKIKFVNSVWYDEWLSPADNFIKIMKNDFYAPVNPIDFTSTENAAREINNWSSKQSNGMIERVVDAKDLANSIVFFANALYFKKNWASPFNDENTYPEKFYGIISEKEIPMMHETMQLDYYETADWDAINIPFEDEYAMLLIRTKKESGNYKLPAMISKNDYDALLESSKKYAVKLSMPKFSYNCSCRIEGFLKTLGIDLKNTDFSKMFGYEINTDIISTNSASIEVDETGAKAAVITTANGIQTAGDTGVSGAVEFNLNKPFTYLIHHTDYKTILLAGQFAQP